MVVDFVLLLLLGLSASIGNFFASMGIGFSLKSRKTMRIKVLVLFGFFEMAISLFGLVLGAGFSSVFLNAGKYVGAGLLVALGAYSILRSSKKESCSFDFGRSGNKHLALIALALSLDNLVIGFAFGHYNLPIPFAAAFMAVISISLSAMGLEMGKRFSKYVVIREALMLGLILVLLGLFIVLG